MSEHETSTARRPPQYCNFACVLYPEDGIHQRILQMMLRYPQLYKAVYILHDKDVYTEEDFENWKSEHDGVSPNWSAGDRKKAHYHVLFSWRCKRDAASMSKFLHVYVEGVSNKFAMLQYMIHDTPEAWGKFPYPVEALEGDKKTIGLLKSQNSNFVQLERVIEQLETGAMVSDVVRWINRQPDSALLYEVFEQYQYLIVAMSTQIDRKLSKVYTEKYFDAKTGAVHYQ